MSALPKFLSPALMDSDGYVHVMDPSHPSDLTWWTPMHRDRELAKRGQRPKGGVWPEGFGVVELEDIPKPEPLPPAYFVSNRLGESSWWLNVPLGPDYTHVATVTFDEDGNPHVERVTQ